MKKMVSEADHMKLMKLMPMHRIEVTVVLIALDAWYQEKHQELLERDCSK